MRTSGEVPDSNCVINLATDKDRVLREAFRVLAVSDVVTKGGVSAEIASSMLAWVVAAQARSKKTNNRAKLAAAGFEQIGVEPTRIYRADDAKELLKDKGMDVARLGSQVDGKFMSAFIRARKPGVEAKPAAEKAKALLGLQVVVVSNLQPARIR
ncbi:MAG TPA: hypothetical protein VFR66_07105, partial [Burkholderiales bacterium]|nr:hypothetical protein [Burkholderiales bacterium]